MFYQLKSFDESLPDSVIATQAGLMASSFTGAQFLTAMMWGRIADSEKGGRKLVLLIGLFGTAVSCLGFGFAKTFWQAILFRTVGGALNGNIGVMRTMVSEIVQEKKFVDLYQSTDPANVRQIGINLELSYCSRCASILVSRIFGVLPIPVRLRRASHPNGSDDLSCCDASPTRIFSSPVGNQEKQG